MTGWLQPMLYALIGALLALLVAWVIYRGMIGMIQDHVIPVPVRVR